MDFDTFIITSEDVKYCTTFVVTSQDIKYCTTFVVTSQDIKYCTTFIVTSEDVAFSIATFAIVGEDIGFAGITGFSVLSYDRNLRVRPFNVASRDIGPVTHTLYYKE